MITISNVLNDLIKTSPFLEEFMSKGLINYSSLARELRPQVEKKLKKPVKDSAVLMALKRMPVSKNQIYAQQISKILRDISDISIRSSLIGYTYKNSSTLKARITELFKEIEQDYDSFFTLSQGIYESEIIINNKWSTLFDKLFAKEECLMVFKDLTSVSIKLPDANTQIKGVYYMIFKYFADSGLNIVNVVSTSNELTILIDSKDSEKAFQTINYIKGTF